MKKLMREGDTVPLFTLYYKGVFADRRREVDVMVQETGIDDLYSFCLDELDSSKMFRAYGDIVAMEKSVRDGAEILLVVREATPGDDDATNSALEMIRKEYGGRDRHRRRPHEDTDRKGNTLLHLAAARGNARVVRELLMKGAPPMCPNSFGELPLHVAAREGHRSCVEMLLSELTKGNAAVDACETRGDSGHENKMKDRRYNSALTPIEAAVASPHVDMAVVRMLAPTSFVEGALGAATVRDDVRTMEDLFGAYPELTTMSVVDSERKQTALHKACLNSALECLKWLVERHAKEVHAARAKKGKKGKAPASSWSLDEFLLRKDAYGRNALHCLMEGEDSGKIALCLDHLLRGCDDFYSTKEETVRELVRSGDVLTCFTTLVFHEETRCYLYVKRWLWKEWCRLPEKLKSAMGRVEMARDWGRIRGGDLAEVHRTTSEYAEAPDCTPLHLGLMTGNEDAVMDVLDYLGEVDKGFFHDAMRMGLLKDAYDHTLAHTAALFDCERVYLRLGGLCAGMENVARQSPEMINRYVGEEEEEEEEEKEEGEEEEADDCGVWYDAVSAASDLRWVADSWDTIVRKARENPVDEYVQFECD